MNALDLFFVYRGRMKCVLLKMTNSGFVTRTDGKCSETSSGKLF
jgi:hypothetical protein